MAALKRAMVVVNKWWECDPVMNALLHEKAWAKGTFQRPLLSNLRYPHFRPQPKPSQPTDAAARAIYELTNTQIEIWCISDLLEHLSEEASDQSSTERKAEQLPRIFAGNEPSLVIGVGTAGFPSEHSINGCVIIGTGIFIHNPYSDGSNTNSNWRGGPFDQVIHSNLGPDLFARLTSATADIYPRLAVAYNMPASKDELGARADHSYVALGEVNITDYKDYKWTDKQTVKAYRDCGHQASPMSLETTHGLIRVQSSAPFMFVSGITDRVGHFDSEVSRNEYIQNMLAAHNAGVAIAAMIPKIDEAFADD